VQFATVATAQTYVYNTVTDGNWTSNSTWQGGASGKPPVSGNCDCTINIDPGHRLTVNQNVNIANAHIVLLGNGSELRFSSEILLAQTIQLTGSSGIELRSSGANIESTSNFFGYNGNSISINGTKVFQGYSTEVNSSTPGVVNGPATVNSAMSPLVFINAILPVKLTSFEAHESNGEVVLEWQTDEELNFEHFEMERSVNGRDWSKIGTLNGRGEEGSGGRYSFTDRLPMRGANYYRLKMADRDGQFEFSSIVVVNIAPQREGMSVYPNPAASVMYISNIPAGSQYIEVINTSGQLVLRRELRSPGNTIMLNVAALGKGLYYLKVAGSSGSMQTREIAIK
jgi:hypothetical protein